MNTFRYTLAATSAKPFELHLPANIFTLHPDHLTAATAILLKDKLSAKESSDLQNCYYLDFTNQTVLSTVNEAIVDQIDLVRYKTEVVGNRSKNPFPFKALWWHNRPVTETPENPTRPENLYDTKYSLNIQVSARLEYLVAKYGMDAIVLDGSQLCTIYKAGYRHFNMHYSKSPRKDLGYIAKFFPDAMAEITKGVIGTEPRYKEPQFLSLQLPVQVV